MLQIDHLSRVGGIRGMFFPGNYNRMGGDLLL